MTEQYDERPERALRDALSHHAGDVEPVELDVTGARRRTPWRAWAAVAAAAVLVAGTAVGVTWWTDDDGTSAGPSENISDGQHAGDRLPPPEAGWRYESYRDIVVQVPDDWGYGSAPGSDWCAVLEDGPATYPTEPFVDTSGANSLVFAILCSPTPEQVPLGMEAPERLWATHISLGEPRDPDSDVPDGATEHDGWTRITTTVGHARFTILADQAHLAEAHQVADSARIVTADHNGCDAISPIQEGLFPRPPHPFDLTSIGSVEAIAVCQYAVPGRPGEPGLIASRLLTGEAANSELGALQFTAIGSGPNDPDTCLPAQTRETAVVLRLDPFTEPHDIYGYYDTCAHNGFDDGTDVRQLTVDNCLPLWGERVLAWLSSSTTAGRCRDTGR